MSGVTVLNMDGPGDDARLEQVKGWFARGAYYNAAYATPQDLGKVLGGSSYFIIVGKPTHDVLELRRKKKPKVRTFVILPHKDPGVAYADPKSHIVPYFASGAAGYCFPEDLERSLRNLGILR